MLSGDADPYRTLSFLAPRTLTRFGVRTAGLSLFTGLIQSSCRRHGLAALQRHRLAWRTPDIFALRY